MFQQVVRECVYDNINSTYNVYNITKKDKQDKSDASTESRSISIPRLKLCQFRCPDTQTKGIALSARHFRHAQKNKANCDPYTGLLYVVMT